MVEERILGRDALTGALETFHFDHADDTFTIQRRSDVEPLIEYNKALSLEQPGNWKGDNHHVASIPAIIYEQLVRDGIARDPARLRKWLNDSNNRVFRTRPGVV